MLKLVNFQKMIHFKCRNNIYPSSKISRSQVSDNQVSWTIPWNDYDPEEYNSNVLENKPWADPNVVDINFTPIWNNMDGPVNRRSYTGEYTIKEKRPLNPVGRTGLTGRGLLGRWGPNHAADPIVSRWKRLNGIIQNHPQTHQPILEVCVIQRRDCNEWALPGGMIDPGEKVSVTLKREFMEEALNSLERDPQAKSKDEAMVSSFFASGADIYKGYVDDPRNTDNAWMETVAVNFHDETGTAVGKFPLQAGDDAKNVKWVEVESSLALYASHGEMIKKVVELRKAHW